MKLSLSNQLLTQLRGSQDVITEYDIPSTYHPTTLLKFNTTHPYTWQIFFQGSQVLHLCITTPLTFQQTIYSITIIQTRETPFHPCNQPKIIASEHADDLVDSISIPTSSLSKSSLIHIPQHLFRTPSSLQYPSQVPAIYPVYLRLAGALRGVNFEEYHCFSLTILVFWFSIHPLPQSFYLPFCRSEQGKHQTDNTVLPPFGAVPSAVEIFPDLYLQFLVPFTSISSHKSPHSFLNQFYSSLTVILNTSLPSSNYLTHLSHQSCNTHLKQLCSCRDSNPKAMAALLNSPAAVHVYRQGTRAVMTVRCWDWEDV